MNKYLTVEEVIEVFKVLSKSQGFYSGLYESICIVKELQPDVYEEFCKSVENRFKDPTDVVMYFES